MSLSSALRARVEKQYQEVPLYIREDVIAAALWAREKLRDHEGAGHDMQVTAEGGKCICSFAKPQWAGDHRGSPEELASEAIVRAVIEYLNGC